MPSQQTLVSFREGLKILQHADDFTTLRQTIDTLISICPPKDLHLAKDAIARVIRLKQSQEAAKFQGYPQALDEVDKKYRDLYIVLRTSDSKVPDPPAPVLHDAYVPAPAPGNQMAKTAPLSGFNLPTLLQWIGTKKKYLLTGGALASTVGGAYWLYNHLHGEKKEKIVIQNPEKESTLERTIRSIQKYKAFTQMVNDPDFSGDYAALIHGKQPANKRKKGSKKTKEARPRSNEWERDEKALMGDMDNAFNSLGLRPQLDYKLPQLPAPRNIDPRDIVGDSEIMSLKPMKSAKKVRKTRKPRKPRKAKVVVQEEPPEAESPFPTATPISKPKKTRRPRKTREPKAPREKTKKSSATSPGRLIPIVKRTKRVKKVNS